MDLLRVASTLLSRAVWEALDFSGENWRSLSFIALFTLAGVALGARRGPDGVRAAIPSDALPAVFIAFTLVVAFHLVAIPYRTHRTHLARIVTLEHQAETLNTALYQKRHMMSVGEPAFENAWGVTMAFRQWRQSLGDQPGKLLITADREAGPVVGAVMSYAVQGSGLGNGNLQNIGITPDRTEDLERAASIDETLVVHARTEVPGVMQLVDALGPRLGRVVRSYKLPEAVGVIDNGKSGLFARENNVPLV